MESPIKSSDIDEILTISTLINSTLEINEVLKRIMDSANRMVEAEASSLLLIDEATDSLYFQVALGDKGAEVKRFTLKIGEGIAGWVAKHSKPLLVEDVQKDSRFFKDISKKINYQTKSILCVPLALKNRTIGVLEVINKKGGGSFTTEDQNILESFSNLAGVAIENARLYTRTDKALVARVAELETLTKVVQQANQDKTKFISVVTHELRIPMTSIKGYTDLLRQSAVGPVNEMQLNFLNVIRTNVDRMSTLVADLSDI